MKNLKQFLDEFNYHILVKQALGVNYFVNPFPPVNFIKMNIDNLDLKTKKILSFFLLGESILKDDFFNNINLDVYNALFNENLLTDDGFMLSLKGCILTSYFGKYILVDSPYHYGNSINDNTDVYLGSDSSILSSILLNKKCCNALDLCSGSGAQSLVLGEYAKKITAIDINPKAIKYSRINLILNDVNNISIIEKDIFTAFEKKYDLIISNPPFVPILDSMEYYSIAGSGGTFGYDKINRILDLANDHLEENGEVIISGECLGIDGELLIKTILEDKLKNGFSISLFCLDEITLEEFIANLKIICKKSYKEKFDEKTILALEDLLRKNNFNSYHRFILLAKKICSEKQSYVDIKKFYNHVFIEDEFEMAIPLNHIKFIKNVDSYNVLYHNQNLLTIDSDVKNLIENGSFVLKDLLKHNSYSEVNSVIKQLLKSKIIKKKEVSKNEGNRK